MRWILILFIPGIALAGGPKWTYPTVRGLDDEMNNVYRDIHTVSSGFSNWAVYTPNFTGLGSVTNINFYWRRVGDTMEVQGIATAGTVSASPASFSLPNSLMTSTIAVQALNGGADFSVIGLWGVAQNSGNFTPLLADANDNLIFFGSGSGSSHPISAVTGSSGFTSNATFTVHCSVPIKGWSF